MIFTEIAMEKSPTQLPVNHDPLEPVDSVTKARIMYAKAKQFWANMLVWPSSSKLDLFQGKNLEVHSNKNVDAFNVPVTGLGAGDQAVDGAQLVWICHLMGWGGEQKTIVT